MSATTVLRYVLDRSPGDAEESIPRVARLLFRVMLSGIFIIAGLKHVVAPAEVATRLEAAPMAHLATWIAPAEALVLLAGVALLVGGLSLLAGFRTRLAALVLLVVLVPITLTVQVGSMSTTGPLFKNIGLAGGLLFFAAHGADVWSLDLLFSRKHVRKDNASQVAP